MKNPPRSRCSAAGFLLGSCAYSSANVRLNKLFRHKHNLLRNNRCLNIKLHLWLNLKVKMFKFRIIQE